MPIYELSFTDTSKIQVNADTEAGAREHVKHLIAESKFLDNGYRGKALASDTVRQVDKYAEREAANKAARG